MGCNGDDEKQRNQKIDGSFRLWLFFFFKAQRHPVFSNTSIMGVFLLLFFSHSAFSFWVMNVKSSLKLSEGWISLWTRCTGMLSVWHNMLLSEQTPWLLGHLHLLTPPLFAGAGGGREEARWGGSDLRAVRLTAPPLHHPGIGHQWVAEASEPSLSLGGRQNLHWTNTRHLVGD